MAQAPTEKNTVNSRSRRRQHEDNTSQQEQQQQQQSLMSMLKGYFYKESIMESDTVRHRMLSKVRENDEGDTGDKENDDVDDYNDTSDDSSVDGDARDVDIELKLHDSEQAKTNRCDGLENDKTNLPFKDDIILHFKKVILWDDPLDTFFYVLIFNIMYWGFVLSTHHNYCSLAIVLQFIQLFRRYYKIQDREPTEFLEKVARFDIICERMALEIFYFRNYFKTIHLLLFISLVFLSLLFPVFTITITEWLVLLYILLASIFVVPVVIFWSSGDEPSVTIKDGEILDFLPEVTEDNLQILKRAGESGDLPSQSSLNTADVKSGPWAEEELKDVMIPSHEEEESDEEVLGIEPSFKKYKLPTSNSSNANSKVREEEWDDEELEGVSMPSYEEDSEDELSDIENQLNEISDNDGSYNGIIPRKRQRLDGNVTSYTNSDSEDEGNNRENNKSIKKYVKEKQKEVKILDKNSKHLDVEKSDNSSDDDFEMIDEEDLKGLKDV